MAHYAFPKGHKINVGRSRSEDIKRRIAEGMRKWHAEVGMSAEARAKISKFHKGKQWGLGRKHTEETKAKLRATRLQENGSNWLGDDVKYSGLHRWLRTNYPKTGTCESCNEIKETGTQWALIKGCDYERKKENFFELCLSCHTAYDRKRNEKGQFT